MDRTGTKGEDKEGRERRGTGRRTGIGTAPGTVAKWEAMSVSVCVPGEQPPGCIRNNLIHLFSQ